MLFNSVDFAIFLPIVFVLYWSLSKKKLIYQNLFIVIVSYIFYGWWDYRFLSLILFSTTTDFTIGKVLSTENDQFKRKVYLWMSIIINLGFLGVFKYHNFFIENFTTAFSFLGFNIESNTLNIILPVGISFYTFQTLSYTIDIYNKKLESSTDFIAFAAFVCFFPQLVAGPIERATNLLPQFYIKRKFDYNKSIDGLHQIVLGLFKKVVIADNSAEIANDIFTNYQIYSGSTLLFGAIFFAFQIYGDFSGYSDIAIGISRIFGFDLKKNFNTPYFSRDIAEFWRKWHISLSTWFRDYVYIPLGGSRGGNGTRIRNTFIIFIVSGFWHGANWTFIAWGTLNALYFLPLMLTKNNRNNIDIVAEGRFLPSLKDFFSIIKTFFLTVFAWIFFRAESMTIAINYISEIFSSSLFSIPQFTNKKNALITLIIISIFILIEWMFREYRHTLEPLNNIKSPVFRCLILSTITIFTFLFMSNSEQEFIYFQF